MVRNRLILTAENLTPVFLRSWKSLFEAEKRRQKPRTDGKADGGKTLHFADLPAAKAPKLSGPKGSQADVIDAPAFDAHGVDHMERKDLFHCWIAANFLM